MLLLPLNLLDFFYHFIIEVPLFAFQSFINVSLELFDLVVVLSLDLSLFRLQLVNINFLGLQHLVLLLLELFNIKIKSLLLTLFHGFPDSLVVLNEVLLLLVHFGVQIPFEFLQLLFGLVLDPSDLAILIPFQLVFILRNFQVDVVLYFISDLFLLLLLVLFPLLFLQLDVLFVLADEFLLLELEVSVDRLDFSHEVLLESCPLLTDLFFSLCPDQRIVCARSHRLGHEVCAP